MVDPLDLRRTEPTVRAHREGNPLIGSKPSLEGRAQRLLLLLTIALLLIGLIPSGTLASHRSRYPDVLGRYSSGYFLFLMMYLLALMGMAGGAVLIWWTGHSRFLLSVETLATKLCENKARLVGLLVLPWALGMTLMDSVQSWAPGRSASFQSAVVLAVLWANLFALMVGMPDPRRVEVIGRYSLVLASLALSLGLMEGTYCLLPQLIPNFVRPHLPGGGIAFRRDLWFDDGLRIAYRYQPNQDFWYDFEASDQDIARLMASEISPKGAPADSILDRVHFVTDQEGFLNESQPGETYSMVALGDSFTARAGSNAPWPERLSEISGEQVRNLGIPGLGTLAELEILENFGLARKPRVVLLGYYEGNDLVVETPGEYAIAQSGLTRPEYYTRNAGSYQSSVALQTLRYGLGSAVSDLLVWITGVNSGGYDGESHRYPLAVSVGDSVLQLTFYDPEVSALTSSREAILGSMNWPIVSEALLTAQDDARRAGAEFVLVYIPTKLSVYLPLVQDEEDLERIIRGVPMSVPGGDGFLDFVGQIDSPEVLLEHYDDQRYVLRQFAERQGIKFVDLTLVFRAEAAKGKELYYPLDTHWNPAGHQLAAEQIAGYLQSWP